MVFPPFLKNIDIYRRISKVRQRQLNIRIRLAAWKQSELLQKDHKIFYFVFLCSFALPHNILFIQKAPTITNGWIFWSPILIFLWVIRRGITSIRGVTIKEPRGRTKGVKLFPRWWVRQVIDYKFAISFPSISLSSIFQGSLPKI